jgi:hypothetical protein
MKVHYRVRKNLPLALVLSDTAPFHTPISFFFNIDFIFIHASQLVSSLQVFPQNFVRFLTSPMCATFPPYLILQRGMGGSETI